MLTTKQRANLRSMANTLKPNIWIGKLGLTDSVVEEIGIALFHNELIKVSVLNNCDADIKEMANNAAAKLDADVVHVIGGKFIMYKFSEKEGIEHIM